MKKSNNFSHLKLVVFLSFVFVNENVFSSEINEEFIRKFHLLKKENYYITTSKTNSILPKINSINEPAKIYFVKNDTLTEKGLLLFYIQSKDTCHACSVELWLYNTNKKPSVVRLTKETGNSGEPPAILEIISKNKHIYFLFKSMFLAQGITESTLELIQYNLEVPKAIEVYFSFLSDTSFEGNNPKCTGWSTVYEFSNDKISFHKNGYQCKGSSDQDRYRNSTKVEKKDSYDFEKED